MTGTALRPTIAAMTALMALALLAAAPVAADEWPTIHGNAANTGYSQEVFDPSFFNFGWENVTGNLVHSSPVTYGVGIWYGSVDGWLYTLDWADGHGYWLYDTGAPVWSSAAVYRDWVYLSSPIGLYMFRVFDPTTAFLFPVSDVVTEYTSPKVSANTVFLVGADGYAYALNATSGAELWKTWVGNTSGYASESFGNETLDFDFAAFDKSYSPPFSWVWTASPAYYKAKLYTGSPDGGLWALDAVTGEVLWRYQAGGPVVGGVAADNNTVYFGSLDGYLYALDAFSGELLWKANLHAAVWATPAVANGHVYAGAYDDNFYCLDAASGAQVWAKPVGGHVSSSAAVTDLFVTFGGENGLLYVLNATSGAELMRFETQDKITSSPAIAHGWIFFTSWDGSLYGIGREVTIITPQPTTTSGTTPHITFTTASPSPSVWVAAAALAAVALVAVRERRG